MISGVSIIPGSVTYLVLVSPSSLFLVLNLAARVIGPQYSTKLFNGSMFNFRIP